VHGSAAGRNLVCTSRARIGYRLAPICSNKRTRSTRKCVPVLGLIPDDFRRTLRSDTLGRDRPIL
jgi:hypothetical protein